VSCQPCSATSHSTPNGLLYGSWFNDKSAINLAGRASRNPVPAADVVMADAAGNISSEHDSEGAHSDDAMSEPEEVELTEQTIITTMEFTGLPRHQVIDLLLHNEGDPTAVMAQLFP